LTYFNVAAHLDAGPTGPPGGPVRLWTCPSISSWCYLHPRKFKDILDNRVGSTKPMRLTPNWQK